MSNLISGFKEAGKKMAFWTNLYNSLCKSCRTKIHILGVRYKNDPKKLKEQIDIQLKKVCPKCKETLKLYEAKYK